MNQFSSLVSVFETKKKTIPKQKTGNWFGNQTYNSVCLKNTQDSSGFESMKEKVKT
jgi:hypothetical protein